MSTECMSSEHHRHESSMVVWGHASLQNFETLCPYTRYKMHLKLITVKKSGCEYTYLGEVSYKHQKEAQLFHVGSSQVR